MRVKRLIVPTQNAYENGADGQSQVGYIISRQSESGDVDWLEVFGFEVPLDHANAEIEKPSEDEGDDGDDHDGGQISTCGPLSMITLCSETVQRLPARARDQTTHEDVVGKREDKERQEVDDCGMDAGVHVEWSQGMVGGVPVVGQPS